MILVTSQSLSQDQQVPRPPVAPGLGRAVAVVIGLTALAFVASLGTTVGALLALRALGVATTSTGGFLALLVVGQLTFLVIGYAYVRGRIPVRVHTPTLRDLRYVLVGVVLAFVVAIGLSLIRATFFPETDSVLSGVLERNPTTLLYLAALSLVLIAPAEELLFRGAIQGRLRRAAGPLGAIVGASATFGLLHLFNFTGALGGALAAAAVVGAASLVWGYVYERTDNLLVPILGHGLYNATLMSVAYLAVVVA